MPIELHLYSCIIIQLRRVYRPGTWCMLCHRHTCTPTHTDWTDILQVQRSLLTLSSPEWESVLLFRHSSTENFVNPRILCRNIFLFWFTKFPSQFQQITSLKKILASYHKMLKSDERKGQEHAFKCFQTHCFFYFF